MNLIVTFIILSLINVVASTIRTLVLHNGNKYLASLISGLYFAFYIFIIIYTVAEFPMWQKCVITFICNVVGVFVVKLIEEKMQKDRLWQIDFTINSNKHNLFEITTKLDEINIPWQYYELGKHTKITCYASTGKESKFIKELIHAYEGKYFITEGVDF